ASRRVSRRASQSLRRAEGCGTVKVSRWFVVIPLASGIATVAAPVSRRTTLVAQMLAGQNRRFVERTIFARCGSAPARRKSPALGIDESRPFRRWGGGGR